MSFMKHNKVFLGNLNHGMSPRYDDPAAGCRSMQGCGDEDCHNCYPERCDVCLAFVDPMIQTEQVGEIKTRCFGCQPVVCEDCGDQLEWDA